MDHSLKFVISCRTYVLDLIWPLSSSSLCNVCLLNFKPKQKSKNYNVLFGMLKARQDVSKRFKSHDSDRWPARSTAKTIAKFGFTESVSSLRMSSEEASPMSGK